MRESRCLWSALAAVLIVAWFAGELRAQEEPVRTIENDYLKREDAFVANALFLAELHQANGDTEAALTVCQKLLVLRPRDRQLAGRVADLYRRAGAHKDLVRLYESLVTVAGENISMLTDLARAQFDAGLSEAGSNTCRRILELRGERPAAFVSLSRDLSARQAPEIALKLLDQGLEHHPEDLSLLFERAHLLYRLGRYQGAAADARILARRLPPDGPQARLAFYLFSRCLLAGEGVSSYFDESDGRLSGLQDNHADALLALARRLRGDGQTGRALSRYREILELYPHSLQAQDARKGISEVDDTREDAK